MLAANTTSELFVAQVKMSLQFVGFFQSDSFKSLLLSFLVDPLEVSRRVLVISSLFQSQCQVPGGIYKVLFS